MRVIGRALAVCCGIVAAVDSTVAQTLVRESGLTGNNGPVATPGVGRIVLAFVLTLIVGVAAIWLLRRALPWLPKGTGQVPTAETLRVVASRNVHIGLKVHVVEAEGTSVLVAESKNGVSLVVLPARTAAATDPPRP